VSLSKLAALNITYATDQTVQITLYYYE